MKPFLLCSSMLLFWVLPSQLHTQPTPTQYTAETQQKIIQTVLDALHETYIFPRISDQIEQHLRQQLEAGRYAETTTLDDFAVRLTADLQAISRDGHLVIRRLPPKVSSADLETKKRQRASEQRITNYGFQRLEILPGNVGYLDLRFFADAATAGPTANAAMEFFAHADALIIDLRRNHGGHPSMTQLLASYFFDEAKHLTDIYSREEDKTHQLWTDAEVLGTRLDDLPIYVLTSQRTFSAAEGFTYHLKHLDRITVIGETTGGGAHPVKQHDFPEFGLRLFLPFARAINPKTGTNWEGTGVKPHHETNADNALRVAQLEALQELLEETENESARFRLNWALDGVTARAQTNELNARDRVALVGVYGPCRIDQQAEALIFRRGSWADHRLVPMGENRFLLDGFEQLRLEFSSQESGRFNELHLLFVDGRREVYQRQP